MGLKDWRLHLLAINRNKKLPWRLFVTLDEIIWMLLASHSVYKDKIMRLMNIESDRKIVFVWFCWYRRHENSKYCFLFLCTRYLKILYNNYCLSMSVYKVFSAQCNRNELMARLMCSVQGGRKRVVFLTTITFRINTTWKIRISNVRSSVPLLVSLMLKFLLV